MKSVSVLGCTCPGHDMIMGTRIPPSYTSRLYPRQYAITVEKVRIGTTLHMRTIITRKDDNGIIVYSHIFQLLHNLSYIYIQPIDHCSKCSVRIELSTISSFTESRTSRLHSTIRLLGYFPRNFLIILSSGTISSACGIMVGYHIKKG